MLNGSVLRDGLPLAGVKLERAVEFQFDDGGMRTAGGVRNVEPENAGNIHPRRSAAGAAGELGTIATEHGCGKNLVPQALERDLAVWLAELDQINRATVGAARASTRP